MRTTYSHSLRVRLTLVAFLLAALATALAQRPASATRSEAIPGTLAASLQKMFGAGNGFNCVVNGSGAVRCNGSNWAGQLGQGNKTTYTETKTVSGLESGVSQVSTGNSHACAVKSSDGSVWCWGYNNGNGIVGSGALGTSGDSYTTPVQVQPTASIRDIVEIDADSQNTCALKTGGEVWCWGENGAGQLGTGASSSGSGEALKIISSGAQAIAVGDTSSCAIMTNGGVKCWGAGGSGQIGNNSAADFFNAPMDVTGISSGALAITVGQNNACVLLVENGMKCWGSNLFGTVGDGTYNTVPRRTPVSVLNVPAGVVSISLGYDQGLLLASSGKMYSWGGNQSNFAMQEWGPVTGATYIAISSSRTSFSENCYMLSDLRVFCRNANTGETPPAPSIPGVPTISVQPGNTEAVITPTPANGGVPVDSYMVTATPGTFTCTVTAPATSCTITGLTNNTPYNFTAKAKNGLGESASSSPAMTATPVAPPATPAIVVQPGNTQAVITPTPSSSGGPVSYYTVTAEPGAFTCTVTTPATSCTITGLANNTLYTFKTTATNASGTSSTSPQVTATPIAPPAIPTLAVEPGDAETMITVTPGAGGGPVVTYTVTAEPGAFTCTVTTPATSCTITGLTNDTLYTFTATTTNGTSTSNSSPQVTATPVAPPATPAIVVQPGNTQAVITPTPGSSGGPVVTYNVTATPGTFSCTVTTPATTCTITGLTNGTLYTFKTTATNASGTSSTSPQVTGTPVAPPAIPAIVVQPGNTQAVITPTPSSSGGPVSYYTVTAEPGAFTCTVTTPATSCTITGLTNETLYTFKTTATNASGTSSTSPQVTATPVAPPAIPTIAVESGINQAIATVKPGAGGGPVVTYTVTAEPGAFTCTVTSPATSCTITGLTNDTPYTFTATTTNGTSTSNSSPQVTATPIAPPSTPTISVESGNNQAIATVKPGAGGGPTQSYIVTATPGGSTCTITTPATTCTVTGLINGTVYSFSAVSKNGSGESLASTGVAISVGMTVSPVGRDSDLLSSNSLSGKLPRAGAGFDFLWWAYVALCCGVFLVCSSRIRRRTYAD